MGTVILLIILSGCGKKAPQPENTRHEDEYVYEKRILRDSIEALEEFNRTILTAETPGAVIRAIEEVNQKLEVLNPEIGRIIEKHPEWGDEPPEELKPIILKFIKENYDFSEKSLTFVLNYSEQYPDNEILNKAVKQLLEVTSKDKTGSDENR